MLDLRRVFAGGGAGFAGSADSGAIPDDQKHGLLSGGVYTTLDYPGAVFTVAEGINDSGTIAGLYLGTDGTTHGFVLKDGVVYTAVDVPGSTFTEIYSINTQGEVAGGYGDSDDNEHGWQVSRRTDRSRVPGSN